MNLTFGIPENLPPLQDGFRFVRNDEGFLRVKRFEGYVPVAEFFVDLNEMQMYPEIRVGMKNQIDETKPVPLPVKT